MSGHTYSGHPLSCATALSVIEVIEEEKLLDNVNMQGEYLKANLSARQKRFPSMQRVRGKGLMLGVEFDPLQKGIQAKLIDLCFTNGLLVYPSVGGPEGKDENGILIAPPFIITRKECDELLERMVLSLDDIT
jgi:4-aminobutyrate aminotransferase-like enzyme